MIIRLLLAIGSAFFLIPAIFAQVPDLFNPGANGQVVALAVQPDGKILVGGLFTVLGGQTRYRLGRLNPDGTLDATFDPNTVAGNGSVYNNVSGLLVQPDGKIVVAGTVPDRQTSRYVWRIGAAGNPDTNFVTSFIGPVNALALQSDGKIWAGGSFTFGKPAFAANIARLQSDGTVESNLTIIANNNVNAVALQPDGKVLIGGAFTALNATNLNRIARLNSDGTVETNFNPDANGIVGTLAVQTDGKILVGGQFTTLGGTNRNRIARLNMDGTIETSFNPDANGVVFTLALQTDGRILLGGSFTMVGGLTRNRIARLNADGSVDTTFDPGANNIINALAIQADSAVIVGGSGLNMLGGLSRTNIGRLVNTEPATQNLSFDGSTLTWLRGGTSPEVWRTTFEVCTNGTDWLMLGAGERVAGGWELAVPDLPVNGNVRARGFLAGGQDNGSAWLVEQIIGPALIVGQPASRTNNAGTVATFHITVGGSTPLSFQWRKGSTLLVDGENISGAGTADLILSNVLGGGAGGYSVIVSNSWGSITSLVATLTVIEPVISLQPVSVTTNSGDTVSFSVQAVGTPSLVYQWRKDGANLAGANDAVLTLADVQKADVGNYNVVVTSAFGSVTSAVATLAVNLSLPDALNSAPDDQVRALAIQPDGKIVLGGNFSHVAGKTTYCLGRLNADGTYDTNFNPGYYNPGANSSVDCVAVQPDGKILVGGWFTLLAEQACNRLGRLNPDGSFDTGFNPTMTSSHANPLVDSLSVQPDGKIVVGGWFTTLDGQPRNYIGRLNNDGTIDTNFNPNANNQVIAVALQPDGKVLLGGWFTSVGGQTHSRIARINSDGMLDTNFNPTANSDVQCLIVQPDGKILVGGTFTTLNDQTRNYLGRLNLDGTLDTTFNPNLNGGVSSMALQADGKIIVGSGIGSGATQTRFGLARLNPDGSVDPAFFPSVGGSINAIAIQMDGQVVLGGLFSSVAGQDRLNLVRLLPADPAIDNLSCDGSTIVWRRGGAGPELLYTTFDLSDDGTNWNAAGFGTRTSTGWELFGLSVRTNMFIRARGRASGGYWSGSSWLIETVLQVSPFTPPRILTGDSVFGWHNGEFSFNTRGLSGQVIVIEATDDFIQWIPIQTNLVTDGGLFPVVDPHSSLFLHRFYRARIF